jgi:hypothetical protein
MGKQLDSKQEKRKGSPAWLAENCLAPALMFDVYTA